MEKDAHVDLQAEKLEEAFSACDFRSVHKHIGELMRFSKNKDSGRKICRITASDGSVCQSAIQEKLEFRKHFTNLMRGKVCQFSEIVDSERQTDATKFESVDPIHAWTHIPSPSDLNTSFHKARPRKAPGEDTIVGTVYSSFSEDIMHLFMPLLLKSYMRIQPPIQWKGGMLQELFKGKGTSSQCKNYRDILLTDDAGKFVLKLVRKQLLPVATLLSHDTQYGGGLNGGETAFAHLQIRIVQDTCMHLRLSSSTLFLDVVAAFASMLRRTVLPSDGGDEAWFKSLHDSGFSREDVESIFAYVKFMASWQRDSEGNLDTTISYDRTLAKAMVQEWFKNTWLSQEGIDGVIVTHFGSLAGTPLADLLYSLAMARVLLNLRNSLKKDNLESSFFINETEIKCSDASFVDDVAMNIVAPASEIVDKSVCVASICYNVFACYAMKLNFSPGKSECVVKIHGTGKKACLKRLAQHNMLFPMEVVGNIPISLLFVNEYKHVGTNTSIGHELSVRVACLFKSTHSLRAKILKNSSICFSQRVNILQMYLLSRGAFQCSTWSNIPDQCLNRFCSAIMRLYRDISGSFYGNKKGDPVLSDGDLLFKFDFVHPCVLIRVARLSLFVRIAKKAPDVLVNLVRSTMQIENSWSSSVMFDLKWLSNSTKLSNCVEYDFNQWFDLARNHSKSFIRIIKEFSKTRFANLDPKSGFSIKKKKNNTCDKDEDGESSALPFFACEQCSYSAPTFQQLALHGFKRHGIKSIWRTYTGGANTCRVCLKCFSNSECLMNHVKRRSKICRHNSILRGPVCTQAEADELDRNDAAAFRSMAMQGHRRHQVLVPVVQAHGPLLPIFSLDDRPPCGHRLGYGHNFL